MSRPSFRIAVTSGEPAGIGPDIISGIDANSFAARLVILGDRELIESRCKTQVANREFVEYLPDRNPPDSGALEILHIPLAQPCITGAPNTANAGYVLEMLKRACQISEPFRSQFGWHIVEVIDRRTVDETEESKRRKIESQLLQQKQREAFDIWTRRLRDEAYVVFPDVQA